MPTHLQVIPCPRKQIIRKCIRDVPCPRAKPQKKKLMVSCTSGERRRASKQLEEAVCSMPPKCVKEEPTCTKAPERPKCCAPKPCPGKERAISQGCPRCESNRIQKLECEVGHNFYSRFNRSIDLLQMIEVFQLRKEIENMKYERQEAERAIQKAILRSARALGGRCKPVLPPSIEKLLDACSDCSDSSSSLTVCATKMPPIQPCHNKPRKKEEFQDCCQGCAR